ncbi:MAG: PD-(D/E)XK nuclease family protein [Fimbriimonadales bacterium]|nr:PD-(D/E)XK nuclease family protein [Fimbriimonadales bacterium]
MARKPTLSPTKISTYLACPSKYRWTYVDDRGKWYIRAKSYYSFGATLHKVLERFHDSRDAGVQTVGQVLAAYEESWIDAGFESPEAMAQAYAEGKVILEQHVRAAAERPSEAKTIAVERLLRADLGDFVLIGRIDRIDEYPDGTLEIVDYKSGRQETSDEEVATDLAMACYQLLVRERYPGRPVRATILALRSGSRGSASLGDEELARFRDDLILLGREILHRDYENLTPVWKPLCEDCDFLPLCRRHPEFEEPGSQAS